MSTNQTLNYKFDLSSELEDQSFALLRTNPKLSGNNKIVITEDGDIYLETIDANVQLANSVYKKKKLNKDGDYSYDLSRFYNDNSTPYDLIYDVKRDVPSDLTAFDEYEFQYEDTYRSGAGLSYSKLYNETFKIFAPIWLEKKIPNKFVIYKIKGTNSAGDNISLKLIDILKNADIVKVFDMSKSSELGSYLRRHVENENFPNSTILANFNKNENFLYRGIDLKNGGFVSKSEYVFDDIIGYDNAIINVNEYITDGLQRNAIISANLINLEFHFNDPLTEPYEINRYFGLFVDEIAEGRLNIKNLVNNHVSAVQQENYYDLSEFGFVDDTNFVLPRYEDFNDATLGYVTSKKGYHNIKNGITWEVGRIPLGNLNNTTLLDFTGFEKQEFTLRAEEFKKIGYDKIRFGISTNTIPTNGDKLAVTKLQKQIWKFNFTTLKTLEDITVSLSNGITVDSLTFNTGSSITQALTNFKLAWESQSENLFSNYNIKIIGDFLIANEKTNSLIISEFTYIASVSKIKIKAGADHVDLNSYIISADISLPKGTINGSYFSCQGSVEDIAYAIELCLKRFNIDFKATREGSIITITSNISGFRYPNLALLSFSTNNMTLDLYDGYLDSTNYLNIDSNEFLVYGLTGGHGESNAFLINIEDFDSGKIITGDYIGSQSLNDYALVLDIIKYDEKYAKVIVDSKKTLAIRKSANVFRKYYPTIGKFSAYSIKDFDFDFFSTMYSKPYELELESYTNMDPNKSIFNQGTFNEAYYNTEPLNFFEFLLPSLEAEDSNVITTIDPITEYDRLQENNNSSLFSKSRIVPYINKFSLKETTNVRETPYLLNVSESFGKTNFAADIEVEGRLSQHMTHEWFYIDKFPKYGESIIKSVSPEEIFSYLNFDVNQTNQSLSLLDFQDVTSNVFDKFMIYDGYAYSVDNDDPSSLKYYSAFPKPKYTVFSEGSNQMFAKTTFKGLQFTIKERKEYINVIPTEFNLSNKYNSYKFSVVLLSSIEENNPHQLLIKAIVNEKFKTVSLLLNLSLQEKIVNYINRRILYELKGRYSDDIDTLANDTNMTGYLDLININLTGTGPYLLNGIGTQFTTQITLNNKGLFNNINVILPPGSSSNNICLSVISVINDTTLLLGEKPKIFNNVCTNEEAILGSISFSQLVNATYLYRNGGENAHNEILSKLSAKYIYDLLETNNTNEIEYITVKEDGSIVNNQFILNIEDGVDIYKPTILTVAEDVKIPSSFRKSISAVGFDLVNRNNPYITHLKRLNGSYNPTFTSIVDFYNPFNKYKVFLGQTVTNLDDKIAREMIFNQKLFRKGTTFMTSKKDYGILKNVFYHKVNEINPGSITKLSPITSLKPVYPLINEVTIDKKDISVFTSNFEMGYYSRSLANGASEPVMGTKSPVSKKSFMVSTAMQPEKNLYLTKFTTTLVNSFKDLNIIRDNNSNTTQTVMFESNDQIFIDFYNETVIIDELLEAGVLSTIKKYINPVDSFGDLTTIEDDARQYALKNLNPLYKIESLQLYVKQLNATNSIIESRNSPEEIFQSNYLEDGNFTYQLHANKPFNLRLIYNKRAGYTYSILAIIKISI